MPPKKQKTTLVTEDVLVEAVRVRVTDQIRQAIDARFDRVERDLQNVSLKSAAHQRLCHSPIRTGWLPMYHGQQLP